MSYKVWQMSDSRITMLTQSWIQFACSNIHVCIRLGFGRVQVAVPYSECHIRIFRSMVRTDITSGTTVGSVVRGEISFILMRIYCLKSLVGFQCKLAPLLQNLPISLHFSYTFHMSGLGPSTYLMKQYTGSKTFLIR